MVLFSDTVKVEASGGEPPDEEINLDYDWVWLRVEDFANVIYDADWSGENNIPKGRAWGTEGGNYTRINILRQNMNGLNKPCGLTEYQEIEIGYLPGSYEPGSCSLPKQYSSAMVVNDYGLMLYNNSQLYMDIPYSELFPFAVGVRGELLHRLDNVYNFSNVRVREYDHMKLYPFTNQVQIMNEILTDFDFIYGYLRFIESSEDLPEEQDGLVFILNETLESEEIIENMSNCGCILIDNSEFRYEPDVETKVPIVLINSSETNLSWILGELANGSELFVDNILNEDVLVFSNYSEVINDYDHDWVGVLRRTMPSESDGGRTYDAGMLMYHNILQYQNIFCKGFIIASNSTETHWMLHSTHGWSWFMLEYRCPFSNRWCVPMFSVNKTIGDWLIENNQTATVSGFIDQEFKLQTIQNPGVISHNVVGYRNISNSPNDAIVVLSNRIDGHWGETPGDSGVGGAVLLGIAKYFNDYNITPKYNLTFLFTTGEEVGMRGAQHFVDSHPKGNRSDGKYNFINFIGFDQLGFNYTRSTCKLNMTINVQNETIARIVNETVNITDYKNKSGYGFTSVIPTRYGSEDYVWQKAGCDNTICFAKDDTDNWDGWHQTGRNYSQGDSLNNIDQNDVNATLELAWELIKYFTVNPDCHLADIIYETINVTGGTVPDTLKATFTVKSILPNDLIMVNASFYNATTEHLITSAIMNYTINRTGVERNITFSLPSNVKEGDYYIAIEVYNSTAKINKKVGLSYSANDTETSPTFHLNRYHTLGDIRIGSTSTTCHNYIRGSKYTPTEDALVHNITAYVYGTIIGDLPVYQCMIYRWNDGHLIGSTDQIQKDSTGWLTFSFNPRPILRNNTQYILSIWGDNNAYVYSTYSYPVGNGYTNDTLTFGTPPENITWGMGLMLYQHSLFCQYGLDLYTPKITNISVSPDLVGFGFNVTLSANVSDNSSGLKEVKIRISEPEGRQGNYSMVHISEDQYQYVYSDTWRVGQYNYSIWAQDNETNSDTSATYHFNVSAEAIISIATLQNSYSGNQYINITDPPNPPENLTLIAQGLTWDKYYDATTGQNILETYQGPMNYQDNGTWVPINNTLSQLPSDHPAYVYGYRNGNDHGLYGVYFKSNAQQDWPVAFTYNKSDDPTIHAVRSKLVGVGYVDPQSNWSYQYLQNVQSSQGQINEYFITYPSVFTGTDVTWSYGNTGLKEEITLSNTTKTMLQNHPPSQYGLNDASSYLVFITKLDYQNLNLYNGSGLLNGNVTISDAGIDLRDVLGQFKCALPLGEAYELNNESNREKLTYRIVHLNGNTYLLSGLKVSKLNEMTFPVVIDPTLTVYSTTNDGYIHKSSTTSFNTAWSASSGTVYSSADYLTIGQKKGTRDPPDYNVYRGFVFFNTSTLPSNAYLDNATLSIYKRDDYSTTDFAITIQNGQPMYPHDPLQSGDYSKSCYSGNGGSLNTASLTSGYNAIPLNNLTWINPTGMTKLCLRSSRDISGTAPTGNEYVNVYSRDFIFSYPPKLVIYYRNQSKIKNTGETDVNGYLLIQVQFYETGKGVAPRWVVDNDTVNETTPRTITSGNQLALDTIFNGQIRASDLTHGTGIYRIYTAFRDPEGNILRTNDDIELEAWWQFSKT